jgi:hypothetical protein
MTVSPAPVKAPPTTKRRQRNLPPEQRSLRPAGHDRTVDQTKSSRSGRCCRNSILCRYPAAAAGGTEQELAQQSEQGQDMLPAGMNEDGVIEDMQAYDAWLADEQTQRDMQRREEVNINHSHRHDEQDDVEIGGTSDDVDWLR